VSHEPLPRTHPSFWPPPLFSLRQPRLNRPLKMKWWLLPQVCDIPFGLFLEGCWR